MAKDNYRYWRDREIEHARSAIKNETKIANEINKLYRDTSREIEKEINTMLSNYASKEGLSMTDVRKQADKIDIRDYEDKAKKYVKDKDFSKKANKEMRRYNLKMKVSRLQLLHSYIDMDLIAAANESESIIYDHLIDVGMNEVKRQSGILGETIKLFRKDIEYIAKRKFHDSDFSNRIWKNKRQLHSELKKRLTEQITRGQNPREAARKLRKEVENSVYNAERIMRTESARVQSESQMESFKEMGFEQYEFITTEGACEICEPLDGEIFELKDARPGENLSPMHPMCRCSSAAYASRDEWEKEIR